MKHQTVVMFWTLAAAWIAAAQPASPQAAPAAGEEIRTRQIWNEAFRQKRPGATKPGEKFSRTKAQAGPAQSVADSLVGMTIWRADGPNWKRIDADSPLAEGQRVRIGIETARTGYLYVINREQFAGGVVGDPVLIFPTLRIRGGDNRVGGGRPVEIPAWSDVPPYFTLARSRSDQVGEVLTLLVTQEPLADVKVGRDAVTLSPQQVETWERRWARGVRRLTARADAGQLYSAAEREAGMRTRSLVHTDPLPQTLFLCGGKPDQPLLFSVPLQIRKQ